MKNLLLLALLALTFSACSGSKAIVFNSLVQSPCKEQTKLNNSSEFTGETVSNLLVYQQSDILYASMDVRTYSNARITFTIEKKENQLRMKLQNANNTKDNFVCIINVATSLKNVAPGSYEIMILNSTGNQLLATKRITVK